MAELKIKADSGGGTVSLKGPATTTSNAAVQLTLPVDDGTANQYLKTDGSGALSWATVSSDVVGDTTPQLGGDLDVNGNQIKGDDVQIHAADNQVIAKFHKTNSSEFHFNGSKKLEVNNTGIGVTGSITPSGGLYLGGAGGDNYLSDYEKGTWNTVLQHGAGAGNCTFNSGPTNVECHYTKIGRTVFCHGYVNAFNISGTETNPNITLPFAVGAGTMHCAGTLVHYNCFDHANIRCLAEPGTSRLDFFQDNAISRTGWAGGSTKYLMFSISYDT